MSKKRTAEGYMVDCYMLSTTKKLIPISSYDCAFYDDMKLSLEDDPRLTDIKHLIVQSEARSNHGDDFAHATLNLVVSVLRRRDIKIDTFELDMVYTMHATPIHVCTIKEFLYHVNKFTSGRGEPLETLALRNLTVAGASSAPSDAKWWLGQMTEIVAHVGKNVIIDHVFPRNKCDKLDWLVLGVANKEKVTWNNVPKDLNVLPLTMGTVESLIVSGLHASEARYLMLGLDGGEVVTPLGLHTSPKNRTMKIFKLHSIYKPSGVFKSIPVLCRTLEDNTTMLIVHVDLTQYGREGDKHIDDDTKDSILNAAHELAMKNNVIKRLEFPPLELRKETRELLLRNRCNAKQLLMVPMDHKKWLNALANNTNNPDVVHWLLTTNPDAFMGGLQYAVDRHHATVGGN